MAAPQAPYSGPWYAPRKDGTLRYKGPAAIAFKRTISRGWEDLIPWRSFNNQYNKVLADAVRKIQAQNSLDVSGHIAMPMFTLLRKRKVPAGKPNAGQWAMDPVSVGLLEDAYDIKFPPADPSLEVIREAIAGYWEGVIAYAARWSYTQARPYSSLGRDPDDGGQGDCSSTACLSFYWARQETGFRVPDPTGYGYSGYGNSQSIWERNRRISGEDFQVGDCALYGPYSGRTTHIVVCMKAGNENASVWGSHGSQAGPNAVRLHYRSDLLGVVRPPLLPT